MKVLILARGIPSKENPQEGCFEWDQARALKSCGMDVVVMALDARMRKGKREYGISKRDIDGIPFYKISWGPTTPIEHLNFKLASLIDNYITKRLLRHIKRQHPDIDIIHAHYMWSIFKAVSLRDIFNVPIVCTEHWSELEKDSLNKKAKYFGSKTYKYCSKLISVSESLRQRILQHFNVDSVVIHNMVGTEFESPIRMNRTHNQKFKFVCTGSLIKRKGFDYLINSFYESGLKSSVQITVIGDGPLKKDLNSQIKELGLEDSIIILGNKQKNEIIELLKESDAFILPSRAENFSVAVLEALSMGLPVIATICGGIKECIDDSNGILVEVDNKPQMIEAMKRMIDNIDTYNRLQIRKDCLNHYGPTVVANKIIDVYKSVVNS